MDHFVVQKTFFGDAFGFAFAFPLAGLFAFAFAFPFFLLDFEQSLIVELPNASSSPQANYTSQFYHLQGQLRFLT